MTNTRLGLCGVGEVSARPIYLDCNATTPTEPTVIDLMARAMADEPGNAGSRTHEYGSSAQRAVERARASVATVVSADPDEVLFTSGATESNNLALMGLAAYGERTGRRHIVATTIEHKAVLEPLEALSRRGFSISLATVDRSGVVNPRAIADLLRPDTLLVSLMHVNNETGVLQPLDEVAKLLDGHLAFLHTDAAQGFGKDLEPLRSPRLDLISVTAHKIYGPKGVGALVARRRGGTRLPLSPLMYGGGQERGLRPGTLPVHLLLGFGEACRLALANHAPRTAACLEFRERLLSKLRPLEPTINGDMRRTLPNTLSLSFSGLDSEAVMLAVKQHVAISNGSACTSASYSPSHVLLAMGLTQTEAESATRWSWSHLTAEPDWEGVVRAIKRLQ